MLPVTSGGSTLRSLEGGGRKEAEGLDSPLLLRAKDAESKSGSLGGATGMPLLFREEDSFFETEAVLDDT